MPLKLPKQFGLGDGFKESDDICCGCVVRSIATVLNLVRAGRYARAGTEKNFVKLLVFSQCGRNSSPKIVVLCISRVLRRALRLSREQVHHGHQRQSYPW